jgi:Domain of unknown function (DUF4388)
MLEEAMALSGELRDVDVATLLQWLGQQRRTGTLTLEHGEGRVWVDFREGEIAAARPDLGHRHELGEMLARAEVLELDGLARARELGVRTGEPLAAVLTREGLVPNHVVAEFLDLQTTEVIYELTTWQRGHFSFEPRDIAEAGRFRTQVILLEGCRRADEWPALREVIPDLAMAFEACAPFPADTSGLGAEDATALQDLRRVYELVQPDRSAFAIITRSRLSEFEGATILMKLLRAGLVRPAFRVGTTTPTPGTLVECRSSMTLAVEPISLHTCIDGNPPVIRSMAVYGGLVVAQQSLLCEEVERREGLPAAHCLAEVHRRFDFRVHQVVFRGAVEHVKPSQGVPQLFVAALAAQARGDTSTAERVVEALVRADPANTRLRQFLDRVQEQRARTSEAFDGDL